MKSVASRSPFSNAKWKTYTVAGTAAAAAGVVGNAQAAIMFIDHNDTLIVDAVVDGNWTDFAINFDGDAVVDVFVSYVAFSANTGAANIWPGDVNTTAVAGFAAGVFNYPSRLPAGASIGPSAAFIAVNSAANQGGRGDLAWGVGYPNSQWDEPAAGPVSTGFLGFRFQSGGQPHFGWVRLSVSPGAHRITVHDAAWETEANTGILAGAVGIPEPGGLGLLALGGLGLTTLRRRKSSPVVD